MKKEIVEKSRTLMKQSTKKNASPTWELTEIAVAKGLEFSKKYKVDKNVIQTTLYLAHTVFHPSKKNSKRKNHTKLSAKFAEEKLVQWGVSEQERKIIVNAIVAHHGKVRAESKEAIIMKNAECYKFITVKGSLIYLHTLGQRGYDYDNAVKTVLEKMEKKFHILTLPECKREAKVNRKKILALFRN